MEKVDYRGFIKTLNRLQDTVMDLAGYEAYIGDEHPDDDDLLGMMIDLESAYGRVQTLIEKYAPVAEASSVWPKVDRPDQPEWPE